ncbi:MAG: hypothetical protein Kow00120_25120 [Anaerolineae bacterium]
MLLAACGRGGPAATAAPTATATVIATGLPTVPPPVPVGSAENPLTLVIAPPGDRAAAREVREAADALAALLSWSPDLPPTPAPTQAAITEDEADAPAPGASATPAPPPEPPYHIDVLLVDTYADVLHALCDQDAPAVGWVDGWAFLYAEASGCATARYLAVGEGGATGVRSMIVRHVPYMPVDEDTEATPVPINTVADLTGRRFCRLSYNDDVSWRIPALMMKAAGVDPVTGLASVTDYDSVEDLIRAVYLGECDAAGMPPDALDGLDLEALGLDKLQPTVDPLDPADAQAIAAAEVILPPLNQAVRRLDTSIEVPGLIMIYPMIVPFDAREKLNNALAPLAESGADAAADAAADAGAGGGEPATEIARALDTLLGVKALRLVEGSEFQALRTFVARAGLDPVAFGR